jgi:hypothetical protein
VRRPSERECDAELRALEQQDASALDRVHEPFEFVASHAAALHQSRSQRVDFALVLSQYLSRVCATVGDPSLNFLYLANLVGGKQVQCVRAITAAGPIWQEMAEDYFGLMARVENCYPVDQPKVLGDLSLRMLSRTIIANLNFEHPATKRPSDDGMPGFMVRVGFEVIHPSLLSVMCLIPASPRSRESVCGPRAVRMRASKTTAGLLWRRPRVEFESRLDSDMPGLIAVSGFGQTRH